MDKELIQALTIICDRLQAEWDLYHEWAEEGEMIIIDRENYHRRKPKKNLTKHLEAILERQFYQS